MTSLVRVELRRLADWRRWWFVLIPLIATAWVVSEEVVATAINQDYVINAWDVPLELVNNAAIFTFVLVPLASLVLGQVALTDRIDGFAALTLPRSGSKARWWIAKLVAMGVASVVFFTAAFLMALIAGWVATGRIEWSLSPYGAATPDSFGSPVEAARYFGPPPFAGLWVPVRVAVVFLYSAIATWALIACCVLPTARWPKAWVPVASTIAVVGVFWGIAPTNLLHPLVHLLWDYHTFSVSSVAVSWWGSALFVGGELLLAVGGGIFLFRRSDILRSVT